VIKNNCCEECPSKIIWLGCLFAAPLTDVNLGHHDRCMPQLATEPESYLGGVLIVLPLVLTGDEQGVQLWS
jgi:hypothetical protein